MNTHHGTYHGSILSQHLYVSLENGTLVDSGKDTIKANLATSFLSKGQDITLDK